MQRHGDMLVVHHGRGADAGMRIALMIASLIKEVQ